jgi:Na+/phosphate symporter
VDSIEQRRKQVAVEIELLSRQVEEMDGKIRAYLADRQNKPHPRHFEFIEKIQNYRIPAEISTKNLLTLLDNLQWKIHYSKQAWKQIWENAEAFQKMAVGQATTAMDVESIHENEEKDTVPGRAQYSVDTLWEIQKEKLRVYGSGESTETKSEFKKRMMQEYKDLSKRRAAGQEIVMTFDKDAKICRLDVK